MRPDEKHTLEALVDKYGGKFVDGDDPPDAYIINKDEKIAVEVTRLVQHVTDDKGNPRSRLADDVPAHDLIDRLDTELQNTIPTGKYIFIILPTPVNNLRRTEKDLSTIIMQMININDTEKEVEICSNSISISLYEGDRESGKKVVAALPNTKSSANIGGNVSYLLNNRINEKENKREELDGVAEYWLALLNEYWIADEESYQNSYESLDIKHGFDKVLLVNDRKGVHEIYKKI